MIAFGKINKECVVDKENSKIEIRDCINLTMTLDHRYSDGGQSAEIYKKFTAYLNDPENAINLYEN